MGRLMASDSRVRPLVRRLRAYVPGEQPRIRGLVKLNTNENPYPPSPKVLRAVKDAVDGRLRLYPPPTASLLRAKLARFHGCRPENVVVGNGSDELLAMAVRAFVEPASAARGGRSTVRGFDPSYSLYPVLAETHGARWSSVPLGPGFSLPPARRSDAALTFVTTPNAPSGRAYSVGELDALCAASRGVVILDEAYVDFADGDAMSIALRRPNVLVARTFSKGYSLCFLRVGYFVGAAALVEALDRIRDSYNVNGLAQVAALATLDDLPYYRSRIREIRATRTRLVAGLTDLGFEVHPSETNFLLARPPRFPARAWLSKLRVRRVLVRWFDLREVRDFLRITVGTDAESDALLRAARAILR
jgi:histidinol-phosphate aminotransferase